LRNKTRGRERAKEKGRINGGGTRADRERGGNHSDLKDQDSYRRQSKVSDTLRREKWSNRGRAGKEKKHRRNSEEGGSFGFEWRGKAAIVTAKKDAQYWGNQSRKRRKEKAALKKSVRGWKKRCGWGGWEQKKVKDPQSRMKKTVSEAKSPRSKRVLTVTGKKS